MAGPGWKNAWHLWGADSGSSYRFRYQTIGCEQLLTYSFSDRPCDCLRLPWLNWPAGGVKRSFGLRQAAAGRLKAGY